MCVGRGLSGIHVSGKISLTIESMKWHKHDVLEILEDAAAWLVALSMFIYGFGKLVQFDGMAASGKMVSELTGMELMWTFYGYSKTFALILGGFEVLGGILLLFRTTRTSGGLLLSTILVNIILQDIFYGVNRGALLAAIIYQTLILAILWNHRHRILEAARILTSRVGKPETRKHTAVRVLLTAVVVILLKILEMLFTSRDWS